MDTTRSPYLSWSAAATGVSAQLGVGPKKGGQSLGIKPKMGPLKVSTVDQQHGQCVVWHLRMSP
jgi:hypothetical protein